MRQTGAVAYYRFYLMFSNSGVEHVTGLAADVLPSSVQFAENAHALNVEFYDHFEDLYALIYEDLENMKYRLEVLVDERHDLGNKLEMVWRGVAMCSESLLEDARHFASSRRIFFCSQR